VRLTTQRKRAISAAAPPLGNPESKIQNPKFHGPDWRAWLAVAWVVYWGWAYAVMATQARWPLVSAWLHSFLGR
jgi:hypothetical protein